MKKLLAVTSTALIVSGCATGIQGEMVLGRPGSPVWVSTASIQTQIHHFKQICFAYGFKDDTPDMSQCLRTETQAAKQRAQDYINSNRPTTTECRPWLNGVRCVER